MFRKKHTTRLDALRKLEQEQTNQKRKLITRARLEGLASSGINAVLFAVVSVVYLIIHYTSDLPDFEQLQRYEPKMVTRLYAGDGRLLEEYAKEKRIFVPIDVIPEQLQNAFISAEDKNFYDHEGIDVQGILRAAVTNFKNLGNEKGLVGGSTITQQVVKNFLLSSEKKYERKIKEAILALRISQVFSKKKVMELYLNEIYLGAGSYGVAAASIRYFDKSIYDLSLEEMAMLASLPKAPNTYNPKRNPEAAKERRNWVIDRMLEQEYINAQEAEEAKAKPITIIEKDQSRMVYHLVKGDRKGRIVTGHNRPQGIANQNNIDIASIEKTGQGIIVSCEHGNFLLLVIEALNIENGLGFSHGNLSFSAVDPAKAAKKKKPF